MNLRRRISPYALLAMALLVSCVTVNVYFPAAEIKDLSKRIEDEVRKEAAKNSGQASDETTPSTAPAPAPNPPNRGTPTEPPNGNAPAGNPSKGGTRGGSLPAAAVRSASLFDTILGVTPAYAAGDVGTPEVTSPAIRKIITSRAARVDALNALKSSGIVGENNQALVEICLCESRRSVAQTTVRGRVCKQAQRR